jgi:hypothetical protein
MIIYTYDFKILKYKFNDIMTIVGGGGDISIVLFMFTNTYLILNLLEKVCLMLSKFNLAILRNTLRDRDNVF